VPDDYMVVGMPCTMENTLVEILTAQYCRAFHVGEDDVADLARVKHLVDLEVKLVRCNRLTAIHPELVNTVWEDGRPRRKLNPIARYDLLLMREHGKVLGSLQAVAMV
jgi:hypothetical protein